MDTMVKEKEAATEKAVALEAEASEYQKTLAKFEKVKTNKITFRVDKNQILGSFGRSAKNRQS